MKPMTSVQIRQAFLDYFAEKGHTIVASSSLVPADDPTLLFTNAGMVQFKDLFLGLEKRSYTRAATSQKCMRVSGKHNDLDNVGPSTRHHTFFEMLGNFSFGDYFKREAIGYAWEFLTERLGLDPARLYPTIYLEDDEAAGLWVEVAGVPAERITRLGKKDNFWSMGDVGPCGPCSEVLYDRGVEHCTCGRADCGPAVECERWWEIWNLVFMQYESHPDGSMTPLPRPSIDTGMGLERLSAVLQGHDSNYKTDLFMPLIRHAQKMLGHSDEQVDKAVVAYRVLADHGRAITFLVGDGVLPGNEGRSYVLRLILRRAARFGKKLGFVEPFLAEIAGVVIDEMGEHYTELKARRDFILRVINGEETRFLQTLSIGLGMLDEMMAELRENGETVIAGDAAFRLYDTYGFPFDLTRDVAREQGFTVDEAGFRAAMAEQKERARSAQHFAAGDTSSVELYVQMLDDLRSTGELGPEGVEHIYDSACSVDSRLIALVKDGERVNTAHPGEEIEAVLAVSPFYVESGGQVGDSGVIGNYDESSGEAQWLIEVDEARRPVAGLIVHRGRVVEGQPREGGTAWAGVDFERRLSTARNHTATHLLHSELRYVLGAHVQQAGSLVGPERLRFDFTHSGMLTRKELDEVERLVNEAILANYPVDADFSTYRDALSEGAIALFGEKYGERVRVIRIGDADERVSQELCGGTHVVTTGEVGFFHILSEGSIGSGVRRIEAVTGRAAYQLTQQRLAVLDDAAAYLGCQAEEVDRKVLELLGQVQSLEKQLEQSQRQAAREEVGSLLSRVRQINDVTVLSVQVGAKNVDTLREMTDWLREELGSAVIVLGAVIKDRPSLVAAVTPDLVARGIHAGELVKEAAKAVRGGGGGRPTLGQAGGSDPSRLPEALESVYVLIEGKLQGKPTA